MNVARKTASLLAVIILFSSQSSEAGLLRKSIIGGGIVGMGAAWYAACHDVNGKVKPGCKLKKKSSGMQDDPLLISNNTLELRKALNADLADSGMPPDPDDCDAHHICVSIH